MGKPVEEREVKDLMTHGVIMVQKNSTTIDVIRTLVEGNVHGAIVTDESNEPCGVVSGIDIPKAFGRDFSKTPITEIMSTNIITIDVNDTIKNAGVMMKDRGIHRLIVVDKEGKMQGILSLWDIVTEIYDLYNEMEKP